MRKSQSRKCTQINGTFKPDLMGGWTELDIGIRLRQFADVYPVADLLALQMISALCLTFCDVAFCWRQAVYQKPCSWLACRRERGSSKKRGVYK